MITTLFAQVSNACDADVNDPKCQPIIANYCGLGNNAAVNPYCAKWLRNYCGNVGTAHESPLCQTFLNGPAAQGIMDEPMAAYCQSYPDDPLCSCINSQIPCPNKQDENCIMNNGYKTADMLTKTCDPVIRCSQQINLPQSAINLGVFVEQDCFGTKSGGLLGFSLITWLLLIVVILFAAVFGVVAYNSVPDIQ